MRAFTSDAIALSSPNGSISKAAKKATLERIRKQLFDGIDISPKVEQPTEREWLLNQAQNLRSLAARGMKPKAYLKEALRLEALAG